MEAVAKPEVLTVFLGIKLGAPKIGPLNDPKNFSNLFWIKYA